MRSRRSVLPAPRTLNPYAYVEISIFCFYRSKRPLGVKTYGRRLLHDVCGARGYPHFSVRVKTQGVS